MYTKLGYESDADVELMGGWLRDKIKNVKKKLGAKMKTMPKWKKALLMATGLGLVMPVTATTALTTAAVAGVPTLMTLGTIRLAKKKAIPAIKAIRAKKAALKAQNQPIPDDLTAQEQAYAQVIAAPEPAATAAPAVDKTVSAQVSAAAAKPSPVAAAVPIVGIGLTLLSLLKK